MHSLLYYSRLYIFWGRTPSLAGRTRWDVQSRADYRKKTMETTSIPISYLPPYDAKGLLGFLAPRAIRGVESINWEGEVPSLRRALRWDSGGSQRWICLEVLFRPGNLELLVHSQGAWDGQEALLDLASRVLDTQTDPAAYTQVLKQDHELSPLLAVHSGLRVPGAWDFFEMGVRAILGQQISVAAAHTLAGRVAARFGTPIETRWAEVSLLWPEPAVLAEANPEQLCELGLTRKRAETVLAFARYVEQGSRDRLESIAGIGPWTASYLDLRARGNQDAFPAGDLGIQKALGIDTSKATAARRKAEERSQLWRPWRSYAVMLLWRSLSQPTAWKREGER